jgi:hypothetical protein
VYNAGRIPGHARNDRIQGIFRIDPRANNIGVIPAKAGIHEALQKLQNAGFPLSRTTVRNKFIMKLERVAGIGLKG